MTTHRKSRRTSFCKTPLILERLTGDSFFVSPTGLEGEAKEQLPKCTEPGRNVRFTQPPINDPKCARGSLSPTHLCTVRTRGKFGKTQQHKLVAPLNPPPARTGFPFPLHQRQPVQLRHFRHSPPAAAQSVRREIRVPVQCSNGGRSDSRVP